MISFSIYADLERDLEEFERTKIFEVLDQIIPGSGCVGKNKKDNHYEVYFSLKATSEKVAIKNANKYMKTILKESEINVGYSIKTQKN